MRTASLFKCTILLFLLIVGVTPAVTIESIYQETTNNTTTLTIRGSAAFSYSFFKPAPNMLVVDLEDTRFATAQPPAVESPLVEQASFLDVEDDDGTRGRIELILASNDVTHEITFDDSTLRIALSGSTTEGQSPSTGTETRTEETEENTEQPVEEPGWLQYLEVEGTTIRLGGRPPFSYNTFTLKEPSRLVVDLNNTIFALSEKEHDVSFPFLTRIRAAQFQVTPEPVARVVFDLNWLEPYDIETLDGELIVRFPEYRAESEVSASTDTAYQSEASKSETASVPEGGSVAATETGVHFPDGDSDAEGTFATTSATTEPEDVIYEAQTDQTTTTDASENSPGETALTEETTSSERTETIESVDDFESVEWFDAPEGTTGEGEDESMEETSVEAAYDEQPEAFFDQLDVASSAETTGEAAAEDETLTVVPFGEDVESDSTGDEESWEIDISDFAWPEEGDVVSLLPSPSERQSSPVRPRPVMERVKRFGRSATFETETITGGTPRYKGQPITLDLKDANVKDLFRLFADLSDLNFVLDESVGGTITLSLKEVPWDQALDIVLKNESLGKTYEKNVVRVAPLAKLRQEEEEKQRYREEKRLAQDRQTVIRKLSYVRAMEVEQALRNFLSKRGEIIRNDRQNMVIVRDIPDYMPEIMQILDRMDQRNRQVEIEARIIETTDNFNKQLGVQWGLGYARDNESSAAFPFTTGNDLHITSSDFDVSLPPVTSFGTFNLFAGKIMNTIDLDIQIQASQAEGRTKILSAPRVIVEDNEEAVMERGEEIPVIVVTATRQLLQTIEAKLKLTVKPQITADDAVILYVNIENTTTGERPVPDQPPVLNTEKAETTLLIEDGSTAVVGGIYKSADTFNENKVPGLYRIPLLGKLFRSRLVDQRNAELLIFLTPKILQ